MVEFGAGSATKTPILLEAIAPAAYVPVDISGDYLEQSAADLQQRFPSLEVIPVVADFARPFSLPGGIEHMPTHDVALSRRFITRPGSLQVIRYSVLYLIWIKERA